MFMQMFRSEISQDYKFGKNQSRFAQSKTYSIDCDNCSLRNSTECFMEES